MGQTLQAFLAALALSWSIGLIVSSRPGVFSQQLQLPRWMPAHWIARYLVFGLEGPVAFLWLFLAFLLTLTGLFLTGFFAWVLLAASLFILGPAAFYIVAQSRESSDRANREFVFLNLNPSLNLGEAPPLFFYMDSADWASLGQEAEAARAFWERFCVAPHLYEVPCNETMLAEIDSLNLYPFLVHPQHPKAMEAFRVALKNVSVSGSDPSLAAQPEASTKKLKKGKPLRDKFSSIVKQGPKNERSSDAEKPEKLKPIGLSSPAAEAARQMDQSHSIGAGETVKAHAAQADDSSHDAFDDLFDDFDGETFDDDDFLRKLREKTKAAGQESQHPQQRHSGSESDDANNVRSARAQAASGLKAGKAEAQHQLHQLQSKLQAKESQSAESQPESAKPERVLGPADRDLQKKQAQVSKPGRQMWNPQAQVKKGRPSSKGKPVQSASTPTLEASYLRQNLSSGKIPQAGDLDTDSNADLNQTEENQSS